MALKCHGRTVGRVNRAITARRVPKAAYLDSLRPRSVLSIGGKWERIFRKPMI